MMGKSLFTGMVILFWVAEFAFGALIAYWFVTQGFDSDKGTASGAIVELEDRSETLKSLVIWGAFFGFILIGIVVGA
jgi:hypothetical protein